MFFIKNRSISCHTLFWGMRALGYILLCVSSYVMNHVLSFSSILFSIHEHDYDCFQRTPPLTLLSSPAVFHVWLCEWAGGAGSLVVQFCSALTGCSAYSSLPAKVRKLFPGISAESLSACIIMHLLILLLPDNWNLFFFLQFPGEQFCSIMNLCDFFRGGSRWYFNELHRRYFNVVLVLLKPWDKVASRCF